jgi:uncharacterized membrane protein YdbT with pleckstrin-like domain
VLQQTASVGKRAGSLPDGEEVVIRLRPHARALVLPLLVLLVSLAMAGFVAARLPEGRWQDPGRWAVAAVTALAVLRGAVVPWLRWLATAFVVSDRRVTVRRGLLRRTSREVPLSRIADVEVERSLSQRLLRTGTLVLDTVGERGGLVVRDVPGVDDVAAQLADLLDLPEDG